jgi:methylenetetrahydrofolate dehydrogenase (NADP+)/methenyltetrahydrofolate cyclohydrolase
VCHSATPDLGSVTRQADVLIAAMGRPQYIKADMVKEGAVVVDVGMNRVDDPKAERGYRLVGDVDFEAVSKRAKAITPVPGGVGLMTRAMLMANTVRAAELAVERAQARRR